MYETSGLGGLTDVDFDIAYLKDKEGSEIDLPANSLEVIAYGTPGTFDVAAGGGKTFLVKLTLPKDLVQGNYILGLQATVAASMAASALNEVTSWTQDEGVYSKVLDTNIRVRVAEEIPLPENVTYTLEDGLVTISGTMEPGKLAVLFVEDVAANILIPDSFGAFTGTYQLKPRAESYDVYMKGADYSANYSSGTTAVRTFTADLPEDEDPPVITLITPADGAVLANDTSKVVFTVEDLLGTVSASDVTLSINGAV